MATNLSSKIRLVVNSLLANVLDLSSVQDNLQQSFENDFGNGTGAGLADEHFHDQRSLSSGANEDLDLAGVLTNGLGVVLTFTKVKAVIVVADPANTTSLTLSRPSSNGAPVFAAGGDAVVLTPGGMFVLTDPSAAGVTITADTGDLLHVVNGSGATAKYDVIVIGVA